MRSFDIVSEIGLHEITNVLDQSSREANKIQRLVKDSKLKVQAALQDQQVRVTGKSRDDLQSVIALVKKGDFDLPLQFTNFRD